MEELIDILDCNGIKINEIKTREEVHAMGLWHRAVLVLVLDKNGKILIQQRTASKKFFPNMWELALTGHVSSGELSYQASIREIMEEYGIQINKEDLNFIYSFRREYFSDVSIEKLFFDVFYIRIDIDSSKIKIQEDEVKNFKIVSIDEFKDMIKENIVHTDIETYYILNLIEKGILC